MITRIKKCRRDIYLLALLLLLSYSAWRHILSLQFQGEGFYYFGQNVGFSLELPLQYDMFARFFFSTVADVFRDRIELYMLFSLIYMLAIDAVFYLVCRIVTGSRLVGFLAALFFSLSLIGKYDVYSSGGYQYFAQRAVVLLPHLLAFLFLVLFFARKSSLFYAVSLFFYLLGVMMGFFGTWSLPVFLFYPLSFLVFNRWCWKTIFTKAILTPVPFVLGNIAIIKGSFYYSGHEVGFLEFFLEKPFWTLKGLGHQLAVLTLPAGAATWLEGDHSTVFTMSGRLIEFTGLATKPLEVIQIFEFVLSLSIYLIAVLLISKLKPEWRILALTAFLSLLVMLLFNLYTNAATIFASSASSRYFYFPYTMVALFWGLCFSALFYLERKLMSFLLVIGCLSFAVNNFSSIEKFRKEDEWKHRANRETFDVLQTQFSKSKKYKYRYVILPGTLGAYGVEFAARYYLHPETHAVSESLRPGDFFDKLATGHTDPEAIYALSFDPRVAQEKVIVDKTNEYRMKLKEASDKIQLK